MITGRFWERIYETDDPLGRLNVRALLYGLVVSLSFVICQLALVPFVQALVASHRGGAALDPITIFKFVGGLLFVVCSLACFHIVHAHSDLIEEAHEGRRYNSAFAVAVEHGFRFFSFGLVAVYLLEVTRRSILISPLTDNAWAYWTGFVEVHLFMIVSMGAHFDIDEWHAAREGALRPFKCVRGLFLFASVSAITCLHALVLIN